MTALLSAFGIVFLAELGDKTMLFALTAATRYRWWLVLAPIVVATALLTALAVVIGGVAGELLPERIVALVAAALFIGFGLWTLLDAEDDDEETPTADPRSPIRVMAVIGAVFFLAELGDKTQIATVSLAGLHAASAWLVWLGATAGMIGVNLIAIVAGARLHRLLPRRLIRLLAAVVFIGFGVVAGVLAFV